MVSLARATRDAVGPDGSASIGRGYDVRDDGGAPIERDRLHPAAFTEIAVIEAVPSSPEERQVVKDPAFGLDRPVTLRPEADGTVAVLDKAGRLQAATLGGETASATAALLEREPDVATWVCWEWLREDGRNAFDLAVSRPELAPRRLPPLAQSTAGGGAPDRRLWLGVAAVVVLILVAFASCL